VTLASFPGTSDRSHLTEFRRSLIRWYRRHARPLPWRQTHDPYQIWISEIMLQQTTVAAVVPYFERFLAAFPTLADLAAAQEQDVLRLWEGLGYYSRARNLHKAARQIINEWGGQFPRTVADLMQLSGVGRYTAGAIASFAFDVRAPIVEANTLRLYARLIGLKLDPKSSAGQQALWDCAATLVPQRRPGEFNQAVMELGARLCTPREPDCPACPVRRWCSAAAHGSQAEIPVPNTRPAPTAVTEIAVAVQRRGKFLLIRRPVGGRWAGLWDFIRYENQHVLPESPAELATAIHDDYNLQIHNTTHLTTLRHSVTRYRISLHCHSAEWIAGKPDHNRHEFHWVAPRQFPEYPLSVTGRKLARLLTGNDEAD
jgi:A/G-specific adenine glycosylase